VLCLLVGWFSQSVILIYPSYFSSFCLSFEHYISAENIEGSARIISEEIAK